MRVDPKTTAQLVRRFENVHAFEAPRRREAWHMII